MFPADQPQWFFKLGGKTETIAPHLAAFETMLKSVRFPNGLSRDPVFEVPAGWKSEDPGAGGMGITRQYIRIADTGLKATLTSAMGSPFSNVERWAGQVGVRPFAEADMAKTTRAIDAQGIKGLFVDVKGSQPPPAPGSGMMMPR
jgi:hypothetical protein